MAKRKSTRGKKRVKFTTSDGEKVSFMARSSGKKRRKSTSKRRKSTRGKKRVSFVSGGKRISFMAKR